MITVLLADDEERVCRLIQALVDWEKLDMQIIGIAHNGIEALDLAQKTNPDIVITDIKMPGCSGLELIERMRKLCTQSEFVIISGYTHFEYAKMAIQYGVSDYLLKPISKQELQETLNRLAQKIKTRKQTESDTNKLRRMLQDDQRKVRSCYLRDVVHHKCIADSLERINREYYFSFQSGLFRGFAVKLDYDPDRFSEAEIRQVVDRVRRIGLSRLQDVSVDLDIWFDNSVGYGIVNYTPENRVRVQKRLGQYLTDLQMKGEIFSDIVFTLAMADEVERETEIGQSVLLARQLVDERLVFGSQKVITNHLNCMRKSIQPYMEEAYSQISTAMDVGDVLGVESVIRQLRQHFESPSQMAGQDIVKIVMQIGEGIVEKLRGHGESEAVVREFHRRCMLSHSVQQLLQCLQNLAEQELSHADASESLEKRRPVQMAKRYLDQHYAESVSLEQVASTIGFNPSYFSVLFKKECGVGFQDYLTEIRIKKAKEILRKSDLSIAEICGQIGYKDLRHFAKTFKKATGLSPGGYRKIYGR